MCFVGRSYFKAQKPKFHDRKNCPDGFNKPNLVYDLFLLGIDQKPFGLKLAYNRLVGANMGEMTPDLADVILIRFGLLF